MPLTGRGGAGNIVDPSTIAQTNTAISNDVEAQRPSTFTDSIDTETYAGTADLEGREKQAYAHKGRGGAGNWFSPKELAQKGTFEGAGTSHVLGDGTPAPGLSGIEKGTGEKKLGASLGAGVGAGGAAGPAYRGRGGAGNYSFGVTESEERAARKKIEEEREKMRGEIEKGVEEGLARPEKAMVTGAEEM